MGRPTPEANVLTEPTTPTGKRHLADVMLGPGSGDESSPVVVARRKTIVAIEREAVEHLTAEWRVQSKRADDEAALADQLAEALQDAHDLAHSRTHTVCPDDCRSRIALIAYEEARR